MWEEPFEQHLLDTNDNIVINCPTEDLERQMASILDGLGYHYPNGETLFSEECWRQYKEDFCYYVDLQGVNVRRGRESSTNSTPFDRYIKCTFYGDTPEPIGEDELLSILEVRK